MRSFDTGVLLKLYLPEPRAAEAVAYVNASGKRPPITPFHELEMRSAFRQKAGRGEITLMECEALIVQMEADLSDGVYERAAVVWPDIFAAVESLSSEHGVIPRTVENESQGRGLFSKQSIRPGASCWDVGWTWRQPARP